MLAFSLLGISLFSRNEVATVDVLNEMATVDVLVARQPIKRGTIIQEPEKLFKMKKVLKGEKPDGAAARYADLKDKVVCISLREAEFIPLDALSTVTHPKIAKGHRAYTIRIDSYKVAGCPLPDNRVDVLLTERDDRGELRSRKLLDNLRILAVDMEEPSEKGQSTGRGATLTLEMTDAQIRTLVEPQVKGTLNWDRRRER